MNHLSDSISVVTLSGTPRVTRTLLVGDEPRDIVFAGSPVRAFITTAHRGQHRTDASISSVPGAGDPQLTTPSVGRADVWVFDPASLGTTLGGTPLRIMKFFSDTPRALAVSPDRKTVYVAAFKSGNQTTTMLELMVCDGFRPNTPCLVDNLSIMPGGNPGPGTNFEGKRAPETGLIVKFNNATGHWEDELGRNWDTAVRFRLPDQDVFSVDASTLTQTASFAHVGTTLFNMVTNPLTGKLYVSNTEAINLRALRRPGCVRRPHRARSPGGNAHQRDLRLDRGAAAPEQAHQLHQARQRSGLRSDGEQSQLVDAAGNGGDQPTVESCMSPRSAPAESVCSVPQRWKADTFNPRTASANYINVTGGGPSGLALDEAARSVVRDDALRQRGEGHRPRDQGAACAARRCQIPNRRRSCKAGRCCTTRRNCRRMARPHARAAISSATTTIWRGTSAIPTIWSRTIRCPRI